MKFASFKLMIASILIVLEEESVRISLTDFFVIAKKDSKDPSKLGFFN